MPDIVTIQLWYSPTSSPYSYWMVLGLHCTATVWSNIVTVQLWYGPTLSLSVGANQQRIMYGKRAHCTVAVWWTHGTVLPLYADTDNSILPIQPVQADSIVVKMLRMIICSSCDGVPFKMKKRKTATSQFKIIYRLMPLSTPVSCHWTVPLNKIHDKLEGDHDWLVPCVCPCLAGTGSPVCSPHQTWTFRLRKKETKVRRDNTRAS